jgi:hypothetical protein
MSSNHEPKPFRLLRVRAHADTQQDLERLKEVTGAVNESDLIRTAIREMADRRHQGKVA